jgi:hypothetical protein
MEDQMDYYDRLNELPLPELLAMYQYSVINRTNWREQYDRHFNNQDSLEFEVARRWLALHESRVVTLSNLIEPRMKECFKGMEGEIEGVY